MGCDIHVRAELKAGRPNTDDIDELEAWLADATPGSLQGNTWEPAETLTPNRYYRPSDPDNSEGQELGVEYEDRFYGGRDYRLFGMLSGVRDDTGPAWFVDRDFPDDASDHVSSDYTLWDDDAHTPGWATLAELQEHDWSECPEFQDTITRLTQVAQQRCGGNAEDVRLVWWYDN